MSADGRKRRERSIQMPKHKHVWQEAPDFTESRLIDGRWRNTRIEREKCECGAWWNNGLHLSAAERGEDIDGYYGVVWTYERLDPELYDDEPERVKVPNE